MQESGKKLQKVRGVHGKYDHFPLAMWARVRRVYGKEEVRTKWDWEKVARGLREGGK